LDISPGGILNGESDALLAITAAHRGRSGDSTAELVTLELLFEETAGDSLTTSEANDLLESLDVYLDDGSGDLDLADTLVTTVATLALTDGVQTVTFTSGADVQVSPGTPRTYLVVVTTTGDASAQTPNIFRLAHLTESSSSARDLSADLPLEIEYAPDTPTAQITAQGGCLALTLSHTGSGSDPVPTPGHSEGCTAGEYVTGESIDLEAAPDCGWLVAGWSGTDDDVGTSTTHSLTMPATAQALSVTYVFPDELNLDGQNLIGTDSREACVLIVAVDTPDVDSVSDTTVFAAGSTVILRAGEEVVFFDETEVLQNAELAVEITTPAPCSP
jgi:hypothetical protein